MSPITTARKTHQERQRGAAMVEFAMVLPLVLLLIMGMIDFGFGLSNLNSMRHGTREAVRRAVVADVGSDPTCVIAGTPAGATKNLVCQVKNKTGLDESRLRVKIVLDTSHAEGEGLILCTQHSLESITGLFSGLLNDKTVHTEVHMRVEKTKSEGADVSIVAFEEAAPAGSDWLWCNT
jgi:hypothetical protein